RWPSSLPARDGISPRRPDAWPRPRPWRPRCWPPAPRPSSLLRVRSPRPLPASAPRVRSPRPLPAAATPALAALVDRRRQLVSMRTAEQHRWQHALPAVPAKVVAHSAWREQALAEIDQELDQLRRATPLGRERDQRPRRVPGGGPAVSRTLRAHLPERGQGA